MTKELTLTGSRTLSLMHAWLLLYTFSYSCQLEKVYIVQLLMVPWNWYRHWHWQNSLSFPLTLTLTLTLSLTEEIEYTLSLDMQLTLTLTLTSTKLFILKKERINFDIIIDRQKHWPWQERWEWEWEFILTLTLPLTWGHWWQKIIKVDRGLNQQSLSHWSCALSIELRLLAGFRAETMDICFLIVIVIDIVLDRQVHNHN